MASPTQYLYRIQPTRPALLSEGATQEEEALVSEHFVYLRELTGKGIVLLAGRTLNTRDVPTPPSDPPITFCDNTKARELLGFAPQTKVYDGLAKTWEWFRAWRTKHG